MRLRRDRPGHRAALALGAVALTLGLAACAGRSAARGMATVAMPPPPPPPVTVAPVAPSVAPEPGLATTTHVVEQGQTLWRIAHAYGIPLETLVEANGVADPAQLEVGRPLVIPGRAEVLSVPPYPEPLPLPGPAAAVVVPSLSTAGALCWPIPDGEVLSRFGDPRPHRRHAGIDIRGRRGDLVLAARSGRVVVSGSRRGYGNTVVLDHGDGLRTLYGHGSELLVKPGDQVEQGQPIARVGRTGNAKTEHCHFEIRRDGVPVDPLPFLRPAAVVSRR